MITGIKIFPVSLGKTKAFVSVTIADCLVLTGIKIIEGQKGLFVAMPQQKVKDDYKDVFFPISKDFRADLHRSILHEYNKFNSAAGYGGQSQAPMFDHTQEIPDNYYPPKDSDLPF